MEAAVTDDGVLLGLRMNVLVEHRRLPERSVPRCTVRRERRARRSRGRRRSRRSSATSTAVFSNKATYVSYRGPWATADFMRERLLDIIGRELEIDPLDIRRRNYVHRDQPPHAMLTGQLFTGVTTQESIEQAARISGWDEFKTQQLAARAEGRYLGLGIASYLEAAPGPKNPAVDSGGGIMGNEVSHVSIERGRQGRDHHPAAPSRAGPSDNTRAGGVRRARRAVRRHRGALRRHRHHAVRIGLHGR